jgi:hypothetical protein
MHAISKIVEKLHVKTNITAQIMIASTDANPSTPSMKLKRLMNQTIPTIASG